LCASYHPFIIVKVAAVRRHKFRDAQCAGTTFIHGGTLTCRRMKVTVKASPPSGGIDSGMPNAPGCFPSWWRAHLCAHVRKMDDDAAGLFFIVIEKNRFVKVK
jgi:hypothetical protein